MDNASLFQHDRKSRSEVVSKILVEDLMDANKDVFAVGVQQHGQWDSNQETYERLILHRQCVFLDDLRKEAETQGPGYHFGDCTCCAVSCNRCIAESCYAEGLEIVEEWKKILQEENLPYDHDAVCKLLAVLMSAEEKWDEFFNKSAVSNDLDLIPTYARWKLLTDEKQKEYFAKAQKFRNYFDIRPVVQGIPWW